MLWNGAGKVGGHLVQIAATVVLARILVPDDFGLLAMVALVTGFGTLFTDMGLGAALVQQRPLLETHRSTVFWFTLGVGLSFMIVVAAAAPLLAWFFGRPALTLLTQAMALQLVLVAAGTTPRSMLIRGMRFRAFAATEFVAVSAGAIAAIALAFSGAGAWALVAQVLVASATGTAMAFLMARWRPTGMPDRQALRDLIPFSSHLTGFAFVNYWARNADNLLIGRVLGSGQLGLYGIAYNLMYLPLQQVSAIVGQVMFPLLAELRSEPERRRRIAGASIQLTTLMTAPILVLMAATGPEIASALFGSVWERAGFLLQALSVAGIAQVMVITTGWIYQSVGRTDVMFRWGLVSAIVVAAAVVLGLRWEVEGVAVAYALASWALALPALLIAGALVDLHLDDLVRLLWPPLLALGVMAAAARIIRGLVTEAGLSDPALLLIVIPASGLVYLITLAWLRPPSMMLALSLLRGSRL
ncbi:MAG TPA: lipopolysaccharide biosynthesis protein [Longimicrobiales bacterium]|nr:lipopolysaccharide biosynthesis protein [Longimicrobiales bacterium]